MSIIRGLKFLTIIFLFAALVIAGCQIPTNQQENAEQPRESTETTIQEPIPEVPEVPEIPEEATPTSTTTLQSKSECSPDYDGVCPSTCSESNDNDCCRKKECYGWVPNKGCMEICTTTSTSSTSSTSTTSTTLDKFKTTTSTTSSSTTSTTTTTLQQEDCSPAQDNVCPLGCGAADDYDCCTDIGYCWHATYGCRSVCL